MAADEKMKQSISPADALRAVRLERGRLEIAREQVWAASWESIVEAFWQDLCLSVWMLRGSRIKLRGIVEQRAMRKCLLFSLLASLFFGPAGRTQVPPAVQNASGMRLVVADENSDPTLRVVLPGHPDSDKTIEVIFPEHVTVRHLGDAEGEHLLLFQPGQHGNRPAWRQVGRSLQYEKDFAGGLHMLATAMLEDDGVRFSYEFVNRSQL